MTDPLVIAVAIAAVLSAISLTVAIADYRARLRRHALFVTENGPKPTIAGTLGSNLPGWFATNAPDDAAADQFGHQLTRLADLLEEDVKLHREQVKMLERLLASRPDAGQTEPS